MATITYKGALAVVTMNDGTTYQMSKAAAKGMSEDGKISKTEITNRGFKPVTNNSGSGGSGTTTQKPSGNLTSGTRAQSPSGSGSGSDTTTQKPTGSTSTTLGTDKTIGKPTASQVGLKNPTEISAYNATLAACGDVEIAYKIAKSAKASYDSAMTHSQVNKDLRDVMDFNNSVQQDNNTDSLKIDGKIRNLKDNAWGAAAVATAPSILGGKSEKAIQGTADEFDASDVFGNAYKYGTETYERQQQYKKAQGDIEVQEQINRFQGSTLSHVANNNKLLSSYTGQSTFNMSDLNESISALEDTYISLEKQLEEAETSLSRAKTNLSYAQDSLEFNKQMYETSKDKLGLRDVASKYETDTKQNEVEVWKAYDSIELYSAKVDELKKRMQSVSGTRDALEGIGNIVSTSNNVVIDTVGNVSVDSLKLNAVSL